MSQTATTLPIEAARQNIEARLNAKEAFVLSAPTGSGKSTQVPRWCAAKGRVLVVEPRRVAARSLAQRVAALEQSKLGERVGYVVRDDRRATDKTRIVFATPGVVLRWLSTGDSENFDTIVLDEFHERTLDVDLILALVLTRFRGQLVIMSATIDLERIAAHIKGAVLQAEGRTYPVTIHHVPGRTTLPRVEGLERRLLDAIDRAKHDPGDILVFLPGKGEIRSAAQSLRGRKDLSVLVLHGGLSLDEQSRVFRPSRERKVILATNVAETSLTVPGVGVVIDSGLVRRTRYHAGRGYLTLSPIAHDSAEQRAGRSGRTAPGVCYRLWAPQARLASMTPPEIHREALAPLVLAAAACNAKAGELPLLDPPKTYALTAAQEELLALQAIEENGAITTRGRQLFRLPIDALLGRILVEAEHAKCLDDAIDLVSGLSLNRPLFGPRPEEDEDDLRASGCDATAMIQALRIGKPRVHGLHALPLQEARATRKRLYKALDRPLPTTADTTLDRKRLGLMLLAADPRLAHVARRRRSKVAWSNGGTEMTLAKESAVDPEKQDVIAVLGSRAIGQGARQTQLLITCAMTLERRWLLTAGLGRDRLATVSLERGKVVARTERVYARMVIGSREQSPSGELVIEAIAELYRRGSLFKGSAKRGSELFEARRLAHWLHGRGLLSAAHEPHPEDGLVSYETWVISRLNTLGVETIDDLELLDAQDLEPAPLPDPVVAQLDRDFPRRLQLGDAVYVAEWHIDAREVMLRKLSGRGSGMPPPSYLPRLGGFKVLLERKGRVVTLRER